MSFTEGFEAEVVLHRWTEIDPCEWIVLFGGPLLKLKMLR